MKFDFVQRDTLSRSAWLARLHNRGGTIDLVHGSSVETRDDFFFEGAWDGRFGDGDFTGAVTVLGSGGRIADAGSVVFAAPSHIYERLYALREDAELFVSNSLAFLLSQSGEELDREHTNYAKTLYRTYGMRAEDKSIRTREGNEIRLFYSSNLVVRPGLAIEEVPKRSIGELADFDSYRRFLESSVAGVAENAADPNRNTPLNRSLTALSSGYDSAATAVLARSIGCVESVSFSEARALDVERYNPGADSGREIAEVLGMDCREVQRLDYLRSARKFPEAEIFATSHLVDLNFLSLEDHLDERSILFTGLRGDIMWCRELDENQDSGGPGIAEFRLRKGFVHFPLPYLGTVDCQPARCKVSGALRRISNSEEMRPWCVGGAYDRPIPRRIVESAGVERAAFGQTKRAVAVWYGREAPEDIMQAASYRDLQAFREGVAGPEANHCFQWGLARIQDRYRL